jgi:hypothetical protein
VVALTHQLCDAQLVHPLRARVPRGTVGLRLRGSQRLVLLSTHGSLLRDGKHTALILSQGFSLTRESSLGDAESSLGDAESSLGDAKSYRKRTVCLCSLGLTAWAHPFKASTYAT